MQYKLTGIIIKRSNLGEADRVLTVLTNNHGKIKVIAKGVRKTLSKLAGHLELFCLTDFVIAEGRTFDIITAAQTKKCYLNLRGNLSSTRMAYYLAEIIDNFTAENENHPEIFNLLENVLDHVEKNLDKLLLAYFEINILLEAGYKPELYNCLKCRNKIRSGVNYFNIEEGGLMCSMCQNSGFEISNDAIKLLRLFLQHKISTIQKVKTNHKLTREVEKVTSTYINNISHKEFKSKKYLKAG